MRVKIAVNGAEHALDVLSGSPLLWVLRDRIGLTGTKYGCGIGVCGACTVHIGGQPVRSCSIAIEDVAGPVTTIEKTAKGRGADLVAAWQAHNVPQCGYCQPGMIMALDAMLADEPGLSQDQIRDRLTNLCRCGTYPRILRAAAAVAGERAR